jgi:hypothetical protein
VIVVKRGQFYKKYGPGPTNSVIVSGNIKVVKAGLLNICGV